ncbi:hypothetical protein JOB18_017000 [Solea senegalensis]|uniref:Uncharacterized protein n=1 Tax=Solea senegalensis TaxID=28829 RepID=A0AAV6SYD2_SOLSE|nr:hypothetical protein JOB18_017000 [Solea senegalensis]
MTNALFLYSLYVDVFTAVLLQTLVQVILLLSTSPYHFSSPAIYDMSVGRRTDKGGRSNRPEETSLLSSQDWNIVSTMPTSNRDLRAVRYNTGHVCFGKTDVSPE